MSAFDAKKYVKTLLCLSAFLGSAPLAAAVSVTSTDDSGPGTLRNAITQINQAGISNSITFNVAGTIDLASPLPPISHFVTGIELNSNAVTINGGNASQALFVYESGASFALTNNGGATGGLTLQNAASRGGTGGGGTFSGGGALGAGGGLFVAPNTTVTVQSVSFSDCQAVGGVGGGVIGSTGAGGGGGGGMNGGNGGNGGAPTNTGTIGGGGGGGGGYGSSGGSNGLGSYGGGGGGGLFFAGGVGGTPPNTAVVGGGGGGSDENAGAVGTSTTGGNGGTGSSGSAGGGGSSGSSGGNGSGFSGGGGGGPGGATQGGDAVNAGGGGGGSSGTITQGGPGGNVSGYFGGGGGSGGSAGDHGSPAGGGGTYAGGGGGGTAFQSTGVTDAQGGSSLFGGGGGAAGAGGNGGTGGFGGGGGGGVTGGTSVFGGGTGGSQAAAAGGGGGAGLGGAIFIGNAATLTIQDHVSFSGNSAQGGVGGNLAGSGVSLGNDIFLTESGQLTFHFGSGTTLTIASSIQSNTTLGGGSGGLSMTGLGSLILSNSNNYAGTTTLGGTGIIQISSDASLGAANNPLAFDGGTLRMTAAVTSARPISITANNGVVQADTGVSTFSGVISGAGALTKTGSGTLALTHASNTYQGGTTISAGILQISADGELGNTFGQIFFGGGTLELTTGVTTARTIELSNAGTIQVDPSPSPSIFTGIISGNGPLIKTGVGTLVITHVSNVYANGTEINGGTIQISDNLNLGLTTGNISFDGGTLQLTAPVTSGRAIVLPGQGIISVDSGATSSTFTGQITGVGPFVKTGIGTLILDQTASFATYTAGTTISQGTLQINDIHSLPVNGGNIVDNGILKLNHTGSLSLTGIISGVGSVNLSSAGTLSLTNTLNNYGGGASISNASGVIQITDNRALGLVTAPFTFNGGGTLEIDSLSAFSSTRSITITTAGTLDIANAIVASFSGPLTGTGSLTTLGTGTVALSGTNTYSGTTTISAGTLRIDGSHSLPSGAVTDNSHLVFNNSSTATFSSAIGGTGDVTMQGSGVVTLSGTSNYTGTTTVSHGTLLVNGSITSTTTVDAGATLGGSGTVGNVILNGTISPGNSIGTIHVGNTTFNAGSQYLVEFNNTTSDLIASSGTVTIDGGTVTLQPLNLTSPLSSYTIITATTVTENTPFTLVNPLTRYFFALQYNAASVDLIQTAAPVPFNVIVTSGNAGAVANCFDALVAAGPADLVPVLQILDVQTPSQIAHSLNQMQPANFNNIAFAEENVAERIRQIYTDHFFEQRVSPCPEKAPWRVWAAPFVENARQHGNDSLPGYKERFAGFSTAFDYSFEKHWMVTAGFSYASTNMQVPTARTKARFKTYAGTVAAAWTDTNWFSDALFSYLYSPVEASRKMHFSVANSTMTAQESLKASHDESSNQILSHLGGGYAVRFVLDEMTTLRLYPFANLDYFFVPEGGYKEHGAGSLDLKVHSKDYDYLRPEAGVGFGYKRCTASTDVTFDVSVSYVREYRFQGKNTKASFEPVDCTFSVSGLNPENNLISPSARLRIAAPANGFSVTLGYHGEYGSHFILNAGEAELRKSF